jgi:3-methyladenine DNA glycosylase/8-oxoguanine DNA glycosylase
MIQKTAEHLKSVDPVLERLTERIGPVSVKARRVPVLQSLVQTIIYQQCQNSFEMSPS